MVLDIHISTGEIFYFLISTGLALILILMTFHHLITYLSQNREKSRSILKVISVLLMIDSGMLMIQQFFNNEPGPVLYISAGVLVYSVGVAIFSFRKRDWIRRSTK